MPLLGDERKKGMRAIKIGRSIEEVIVRRRFELDNQPVWPAGSNNQKMPKPTNSVELEGRDGGYSLLVGGPVGYKLSSNHNGNHHNSNNQQEVQRYEHFSSNDYNSMANYCQSLRYRVKELEAMLAERMTLTDDLSLVHPRRGLSSRAMSILQLRTPSLTPISSPGPFQSRQGTRGGAKERFSISRETTTISHSGEIDDATFEEIKDPFIGLSNTAVEKSGVGTREGAREGTREGSRVGTKEGRRDGLTSSRGGTRQNSRGAIGGRDDTKERDRAKEEALAISIAGLDSKIGDLKSLFRKEDPLERRVTAATSITAQVRGFLARARVAHYRSSLVEWRWGRCRHVAVVLDQMLAGQSVLDSRIEQKQTVTEARLLRAAFKGWFGVTKQFERHRHEIRALSLTFATKRRALAIRHAFKCFFNGTLGLQSDREASRVRRTLAVSVRSELSEQLRARGQPGVVLEEEFRMNLYRRLVTNQVEVRKVKFVRSVFAAFVSLLKDARWGEMAAAQYRFRASAGKCFHAWSEWIYLVSVGLDRKRWKSAGKYQVHYNQKKLDYFSRVRQLRVVFRPWKARHLLLMQVKAKMRYKLMQFTRSYFVALRIITHTQRGLRRVVIDNWRAYATDIMSSPFSAWAGLAAVARTAVNEKTRLAAAYRRWKTRQFHKTILRTWRHQALYGRTDGLYSRAMLAKGLKNQKSLTDRLEKLLVAQTVELEECKEIIDREILKRFELEGRLQVAIGDVHRQEMFCHHAEQEVKRIEAIVEVMALINPRQVEHLKKMQPQFRFKERHVTITLPTTASHTAASPPTPSLLTSRPTSTPFPVSVSDLTVTAPSSSSSGSSFVASSLFSGTAAMEEEGGKKERNAHLPTPTPTQMLEQRIDDTSDPPLQLPALHHSSTTGDKGGTRSPSSVLGSSSPFSTLPVPPPLLALADITKGERLLLDRAKWLVSRFDSEGGLKALKDMDVEKKQQGREVEGKDGGGYTGNQMHYGVRPAGLDRDIIPDVSLSAEKIRNAHPSQPNSRTMERETDKNRDSTPFLTAGRMLLSFVDFLSEGDLTLFDEEDRRDWTRDVLSAVMLDQQQELCVLHEVRSLSDTLSRSSALPGHSAGNHTDKSSERSRGSTRFDRNAARTNSAKAEVDAEDAAMSAAGQGEGEGKGEERGVADMRRGGLGSRTWRHTLIQLRTMFPGGGNYSGVGVPLDPHESGQGEGGGMYARLLEMRETQVEVMKMKMHVRHKGTDTVTSEGGSVRGAYLAPNLYSNNLRAELADAKSS